MTRRREESTPAIVMMNNQVHSESMAASLSRFIYSLVASRHAACDRYTDRTCDCWIANLRHVPMSCRPCTFDWRVTRYVYDLVSNIQPFRRNYSAGPDVVARCRTSTSHVWCGLWRVPRVRRGAWVPIRGGRDLAILYYVDII